MRLMWMLVVLLIHGIAYAEPGQVRRFPAQGRVHVQLRVQGSTDLEVFGAVIQDYQRLHPGSEVIYEDVIAWDIYDHYVHPARDAIKADMLISASMDLQTKLVNDGHALAHRSAQTAALPAWAQWRHEVFGISYEPVAIVYNTRNLDAARVPRTRRQLLALLRAPDAPLRGKVGTYNVERSGVGYLFATQDGQVGSIAGALLAALGTNRVALEERTGTLLDRVSRGELLLAYNVLGSYAQARIDAGAPLGIVQPQDYTLVALRTAVIPKTAPHALEARRFLDYLLSPRGQQVLSREARLMPILQAAGGRGGSAQPPFRPIPLGPGLLVYLDKLKRRQFWRLAREHAAAALGQGSGGGHVPDLAHGRSHHSRRRRPPAVPRCRAPCAAADPAAGQCVEASSAATLSAMLRSHPQAELVLLDLAMPGARGFSALLHVRGEHPDIPVVVISSNDHPRVIRRAQQFGAAGFIPKSTPAESIGTAVASVLDGGTWFPPMTAERSEADAQLASKLAQLTPQQFRVLLSLADGLLNKQIAHELGLAENTVKVHVTAILKKLDCYSRTQAAVLVKALEPEGEG